MSMVSMICGSFQHLLPATPYIVAFHVVRRGRAKAHWRVQTFHGRKISPLNFRIYFLICQGFCRVGECNRAWKRLEAVAFGEVRAFPNQRMSGKMPLSAAGHRA